MSNAYIRLLIFLYTAEKSSVDFTIANVLLQNYSCFPDILIEDIAKMAHTTPASITKFAHKLQYKSFKELRNDCKTLHDHEVIAQQLTLATQNYEQACFTFLQEEKKKLDFYMQYHEESMIRAVAQELNGKTSIAVCYTPYSYTCVHVLRSYLEPYHIQVQGILRDLDLDFMEERLKDIDLIWIINLSGSWIKEQKTWLMKQKEKGKQFFVITAVYEHSVQELTPYIFPFQFHDTILDTATQISCLFVKIVLAYANFTKLEKSQ